MTYPARALLITLSSTALIACGGGGAGGGDVMSADAVADMSIADLGDRLIDDSEDLAALLSTIDSEASAEAAKAEIEAMAANYRVIMERFENFDESELGMGDAMALARRAPKLAVNAQAVAEEVDRLQRDHPEASDIIGRVLDDL